MKKVLNKDYKVLANGKPLATESSLGAGAAVGLVNASAARLRMFLAEFTNSRQVPSTVTRSDGETYINTDAPFINAGIDEAFIVSSMSQQIPDDGETWTVIAREKILSEGTIIILRSGAGRLHLCSSTSLVNITGQANGTQLVTPVGMPPFNQIKVGDVFKGGDVLLIASQVSEGAVKYGFNANIITASHHQAVEDGWVVSETFAKKAATSTYKYDVALKPNAVILQDIPAVGDIIAPGAPIMIYREIENIIDFKRWENDPTVMPSDIALYSRSPEEMEIVEVLINIAPNQAPEKILQYQDITNTPAIAKALNDTKGTTQNQYRAILDVLGIRDADPDLMTDELMILLIKAGCLSKSKVKVVDNVGNTLPALTITIIGQSITPLHHGAKMATTNGCKGVIVDILPDDKMPEGVDVILGANVQFKRNIPTDAILGFQGATVHNAKNMVLKTLGLTKHSPISLIEKQLRTVSDDTILEALAIWLRLVDIYNPYQSEAIRDLSVRDSITYVKEMVRYSLFSVVRNTTLTLEINHRQIINDPRLKEFMPKYGKFKLWDELSGGYVESIKESYVGNLYVFPQIYDGYNISATGSCSYFPSGTISRKPLNAHQYNSPVRPSAVTLAGTDEITQTPMGCDLPTLALHNWLCDREPTIDILRNNVENGIAPNIPASADGYTNAYRLIYHLVSVIGCLRFVPGDNIDGLTNSPVIVDEVIVPKQLEFH